MYYLVGRDVESRSRDPATKNLLIINKKKPQTAIFVYTQKGTIL